MLLVVMPHTEDQCELEKKKFWNEVDEVMQSIPRNKSVVIYRRGFQWLCYLKNAVEGTRKYCASLVFKIGRQKVRMW